MSISLGELAEAVEELAPTELAESWDNVGIQIGDFTRTVNHILVAVDTTLEVVEEAVDKECELILSHHPVILSPVRRILSNEPAAQIVSALIRGDVSLYVAHTNLDSTFPGVSDALADKLGIMSTKALLPKISGGDYKVVTFVPRDNVNTVRDAMSDAGAGKIGNYSHCSFQSTGTGTFMPGQEAAPFIGEQGKLESVDEIRLEMVANKRVLGKVIEAMKSVHPYEEAAYDIYPLVNENPKVGLGRVGNLEKEQSLAKFSQHVFQSLGVDTGRVIGDPEIMIRRVAVCGGSGRNLIEAAARAGAQALVAGDFGHHDALNAIQLGIGLVDAGHYSTEYPVIQRLINYLSRWFANRITISATGIITNPYTFS